MVTLEVTPDLIQPLGNAKDQGTDTLLDFCQLKFDHA